MLDFSMARKSLTCVLLLAVLLGACAPAPTLAMDYTALSADFDATGRMLAQRGYFSGSVLVARNGQVILSQGYGFADYAQHIPNTAQTKFRIGSITKQFTAMAILILQEQGKLTVSDKLCAYLADCPESWQAVTLHQLLTHTSGIPDTTNLSESLDQAIADAKARPLDFQPGEKFGWSNTGYNLLGKVIEAASGQTYESFLQQNIFEPLGMSNTGYDHGQADLALGYETSGSYPVMLDNPDVLFACGALYSTVEDLYRWDQALYTARLVSQKTLDAMFTAYVVIPDSGGQSYGYGWVIRLGTPRLIMHDGVLTGFRSVIFRYPDDKTTIIVLANQQNLDPISLAGLIAGKLAEN